MIEIVKQSCSIIDESNEKNAVQQIELAARNCYKSEDKISDTSANILVKGLINKGHLAMLEFGYRPIFIIPLKYVNDFLLCKIFTSETKGYSTKHIDISYDDSIHRFVISASIRGYMEFFTYYLNTHFGTLLYNSLKTIIDIDLFINCKEPSLQINEELLKSLSIIDLTEHEKEIHQYFTLKLITNVGVMTELTRHEGECSFAIESTRYCNYKRKGFVFVEPVFLKDKNTTEEYQLWIASCENNQLDYDYFMTLGYNPEDARCVLNKSLKTEIIMKASRKELKYILSLRSKKNNHPDIIELMNLIKTELKWE